MDRRANLGRAIERCLRCTGDVINACSLVGASNTNVEYEKAMSAYNIALGRFEKDRERHGCLGQSNKIVALAKDWLGAYQDVQVFDKLPPLLTAVQRSAEVAALSTTSPVSRHRSVRLVAYASLACFILLGHACDMVSQLRYHSGSSVQEPAADRAVEALWGRGLVDAVAAAAVSVVATGQRELHKSTATTALTTDDLHNCVEVVGGAALTVNEYLLFLAESVGRSLTALCVEGHLPAQVQLPPEAVRALEALGDSQLMAAAATSLVDSPAVSTLAAVDPGLCNRLLYLVQGGCQYAGNALSCMPWMRWALYESGGPEAQRLACGLLRAMRHVAVRRLQVGLLDQLAAHAGMGAELSEGGRLEEAMEQQQEASGWEGSSGTWWFAREEAQQGQLLGMHLAGGVGGRRGGHQASRSKAGLEEAHCHTVYGTLGTWGGGVQERAAAAAAGVPAGPPPLLAARLAARAAEAVCRLCRGQGLEGAYAPAPEWQFAMSPDVVSWLVPPEYWDSLPVPTARACAPHWLEAAGWLAALLSDATAAAMGRLPAAQRPEQPRNNITMVVEGSQADTLVAVVDDLAHLVRHGTYGFKTLPAAAQDDTCRRMARCGLAASLDHTLRLLFSAQDLMPTGKTAIAKDLGKASLSVSRDMEAVLEALPPPMGGQAEGQGGGEAAGPQLGLLLTLSKRATMVARALEAGAGAGEGEGAGAQQQWVGRAAEVLAVMTAAAGSLEGCVRERVAAKAAVRAAAATGRGTGDGGGEECIDEVQEALALAARAASCLAAALAWRLATEMGTGAAAAGGPTAARDWAAWQAGTRAVCGVLACALRWWCDPPLLPPAQLLLCQPHRLLAAACTLAAALPVKTKKLGKHKQRLCALVASAAAVLASHVTLSGRARGWLAPPPAAAATSNDDSGSGDGGGSQGSQGVEHEADPCAGCLAAPLLALVRQAAGTAPSYAAHTAALLRAAGGGEGTAAGEADGGFRRFAAAVAEAMVADSCRDAQPRGEFNEVPMPDGSSPSTLLHGESEGDGARGVPPVPPPPPPASAPPGALPPPLALPPSRQGALPRLRVCGNSGCGNFAEESEGALPFKQCGGCRAVRYCGADCQRAHWREGHRAECKMLAAEA